MLDKVTNPLIKLVELAIIAILNRNGINIPNFGTITDIKKGGEKNDGARMHNRCSSQRRSIPAGFQ
jgi:hypothetical protein